MEPTRRAVPFNELGRSDVGQVGGKNTPLGEMTNRLGAAGIRVPPGFATTAEAYEEILTDLAELPATRTRVMLNLADPSAAFRWWRLPADGVGLARPEFIVAHQVKVHPMALLHPERLDPHDRHVIDRLTEGTADSTSSIAWPTGSPGSPFPAGQRDRPDRRFPLADPRRRADQRLHDQRVRQASRPPAVRT